MYIKKDKQSAMQINLPQMDEKRVLSSILFIKKKLFIFFSI